MVVAEQAPAMPTKPATMQKTRNEGPELIQRPLSVVFELRTSREIFGGTRSLTAPPSACQQLFQTLSSLVRNVCRSRNGYLRPFETSANEGQGKTLPVEE